MQWNPIDFNINEIKQVIFKVCALHNQDNHTPIKQVRCCTHVAPPPLPPKVRNVTNLIQTGVEFSIQIRPIAL